MTSGSGRTPARGWRGRGGHESLDRDDRVVDSQPREHGLQRVDRALHQGGVHDPTVDQAQGDDARGARVLAVVSPWAYEWQARAPALAVTVGIEAQRSPAGPSQVTRKPRLAFGTEAGGVSGGRSVSQSCCNRQDLGSAARAGSPAVRTVAPCPV